ncbi:MAG: septal ring lytic transglycosylase RlpA family protein [Alphaproteobacteria bacterium]
MKPGFLSALLACLLMLASCAEAELASHVAKKTFPRAQQQGNFKVGNPYKVEGKTYTPQETYSYTETGIASWYGPGFHGKHTANGERFDRNELTAAHRTLQMPSLVRVTNLENGRSLVVRINDRGPFKRGRVIDVSQRAAELLDFKGNGTAKVRLDLLADESKALAMAARQGHDTSGVEVAINEGREAAPLTAPAPVQTAGYQPISYTPGQATVGPDVPGHIKDGQFFPDPVLEQYPVTPTNIFVQAGSFTNQENAMQLAQSLRSIGPAQVRPVLVNGRQFYRVRLGPVASVEQADSLLARVSSTGRKESIIVVE